MFLNYEVYGKTFNNDGIEDIEKWKKELISASLSGHGIHLEFIDTEEKGLGFLIGEVGFNDINTITELGAPFIDTILNGTGEDKINYSKADSFTKLNNYIKEIKKVGSQIFVSAKINRQLAELEDKQKTVLRIKLAGEYRLINQRRLLVFKNKSVYEKDTLIYIPKIDIDELIEILLVRYDLMKQKLESAKGQILNNQVDKSKSKYYRQIKELLYGAQQEGYFQGDPTEIIEYLSGNSEHYPSKLLWEGPQLALFAVFRIITDDVIDEYYNGPINKKNIWKPAGVCFYDSNENPKPLSERVKTQGSRLEEQRGQLILRRLRKYIDPTIHPWEE